MKTDTETTQSTAYLACLRHLEGLAGSDIELAIIATVIRTYRTRIRRQKAAEKAARRIAQLEELSSLSA
jgi:hypothetical protein